MIEEPLVDIEVKILSETDHAYKIYDGRIEAWVPKSECQNNFDGSFTISHWLAIERGFV